MPFPEYWNIDPTKGVLGPRVPSGVHSIRAWVDAITNASGLFEDGAYVWSALPGASTTKPYDVNLFVPTDPITKPPFGDLLNGGVLTGGGYAYNPKQSNLPYPPPPPQPTPMLFCSSMWISNDGAEKLEISWDGVNVQWTLLPGKEFLWRNKYVAGVAVRSAAPTAFRIGAW